MQTGVNTQLVEGRGARGGRGGRGGAELPPGFLHTPPLNLGPVLGPIQSPHLPLDIPVALRRRRRIKEIAGPATTFAHIGMCGALNRTTRSRRSLAAARKLN